MTTMTPTPQIYLSVNGDCEAAFRFYEQRLGATSGGMFRYANSPRAGAAPPGWETKIMHGSITLGGITIAGADPLPADYETPKGFRIFLEVDDPADTERLFQALAGSSPREWIARELPFLQDYELPLGEDEAHDPSHAELPVVRRRL